MSYHFLIILSRRNIFSQVPPFDITDVAAFTLFVIGGCWLFKKNLLSSESCLIFFLSL